VSWPSESDPLSVPIPLDEFNTRCFKSLPYRRFVSERHGDLSFNDLDPPNGCDADLGFGG